MISVSTTRVTLKNSVNGRLTLYWGSTYWVTLEGETEEQELVFDRYEPIRDNLIFSYRDEEGLWISVEIPPQWIKRIQHYSDSLEAVRKILEKGEKKDEKEN